MKTRETGAVLSPEELFTPCGPETLAFETTVELEGLDETLGQDRAARAVRFGMGIRKDGFNLFVLGPSGSGRHEMTLRLLRATADDQTIPPDWCHVNDFDHPHEPRVIRLPPGKGGEFRRDMETLIQELQAAIPEAFESDSYKTRLQEIEEEFGEIRAKGFQRLEKDAAKQDVALIETPVGFAFAPRKDSKVINAEDFEKLPEPEKEKISATLEALQTRLQELLRSMPALRKKKHERVRELNREVAELSVGHLIEDVRTRYADHEVILEYLDEARKDILENVDTFRKQETPQLPFAMEGSERPSLQRYQVNLLVDNSETTGAPVVHESNPTHANLVGRVEHRSQFGTLSTDFSLIRAGALHAANGGYLVLDAQKVLMQPGAWESVKRVLQAKKIHIESLGQAYSLISTVSLEPEPVPLDLKVVLVGSRSLYYLLNQHDPDFADLFKVVADFEDRIEASQENCQLYARLVATVARQDDLRPFDRTAVARVIEQGRRLASDSERLTTHMRTLADLLREADHWAGEAGHDTVTALHVQQALDAQVERVDRLRDRLREEVLRGTLLIDTEGEQVGQVNGLSVLDLGNFAFGHVARISATARLGKGDVVDIEREAKLGGNIHSKGVLILSSFLANRYSRELPLSLSASIVFEQSYGMIDGDSASVAETCALLSALSDVPILQSLAVTGSVNQHGRVQAIGGVNEKIEGFFDICAARGLTGDQGVVIPRSNVKHLMLRHDVVAAAREGRFHVHAVDTVDGALEVLTGRTAGAPDADGSFPEDGVNGLVAARLERLMKKRLELSAAGKGGRESQDVAKDDLDADAGEPGGEAGHG